jgi:hypothetical protein
MKYLSIAIAVLLALSVLTFAIDSKIRIRIYRKTLHEVIEKNGLLISDYASTDLGTIDISKLTVKDAVLSLQPQSGSWDDFEIDLKFIEGKGFHLALNDFSYTLTGKVNSKDATLAGNLDKISFDLEIKNSEHKDDGLFSADNLPQFDISNYKADFDQKSIKWDIEGDQKLEDDLSQKTHEWLNAALEGQVIAAKFILNNGQKYIAEYLASSIDSSTFEGSLSFSEVKFFDDYAELGLVTSFDIQGGEDYEVRDVDGKAELAGDDRNAIEIVLDENMINSGLHTAFHHDSDFSLRSILRTDSDDNEYAATFDALLMTSVIAQGWKEIELEFGEDKK